MDKKCSQDDSASGCALLGEGFTFPTPLLLQLALKQSGSGDLEDKWINKYKYPPKHTQNPPKTKTPISGNIFEEVNQFHFTYRDVAIFSKHLQKYLWINPTNRLGIRSGNFKTGSGSWIRRFVFRKDM